MPNEKDVPDQSPKKLTIEELEDVVGGTNSNNNTGENNYGGNTSVAADKHRS